MDVAPDELDTGRGTDTSLDGPRDAADLADDGADVPGDSSPDVLPPCECSEGPCCAEFQFRGPEVVCRDVGASELRCVSDLACGGGVEQRAASRHCSGTDARCRGALGEWTAWERVATCGPEEVCDLAARDCVFSPACACGARCDDGAPCTDDTCLPGGACEHAPHTCYDGNACTAEACVPGVGCVSRPVVCDDADPCTADRCDPAHGCEHAPLSCEDDGDPCTENVCVAGQCEAVPVVCDDGDTCTLDRCESFGCYSLPFYSFPRRCTRNGLPGRCLNGVCCLIQCDDRECGPDGCGGQCPICGEGGRCVDGQCCDPRCEGRECGPDGCGGECGACPAGQSCKDGTCCTPNCAGRECGPDGCGGACGICDGDSCFDHFCTPTGECAWTPHCNSGGIACVAHRCLGGGVCEYLLVDSFCDDGIECTQDLCLPELGGCKSYELSCGCSDDDLEDDDTFEQAHVLTEGSWMVEPRSVWPDLDHWRIDAPPGAQVRARILASTYPDAPLLLELLDARGVLASAPGVPEGGVIDMALPDRTAYYLRVTPSTRTPCVSYRLFVTVRAPVTPPAECNVVCPTLPCYTAECNAQGFCEYHPDDPSGWRQREVLIWVPPGTVPMGLAGEPVVSVGRGFFVDKYEVSAEEYLAQPRCHGAGACFDKSYLDRDPEGYTVAWDEAAEMAVIGSHCESGPPGERGSCAAHPMTYVGQYDAVRYCRWRGGSLCSESWWERAAKGSEQRSYPWGDAPSPGGVGWDPPRANCAEDVCADGYERTAPVDAFPDGASPVGCYGMAGNVSEWVLDHWDLSTGELPADFPLDGHSWRGGLDSARVVRGAAWRRFRSDTTLMETRHGSDSAGNWLGFRCCRSFGDDSPACECNDQTCP